MKWILEVKERTTIKGMTKEVIIDLRSRYANTLLTTFITASATPIVRSSPYHEILVCRWLVGGDRIVTDVMERENSKNSHRINMESFPLSDET